MLTFHKPSKKDDIHLRLPKLIINNHKIQRENLLSLLGFRPTLNTERTYKTY